MTRRRLLLDMDEVLVDFIQGACEAHGVTRKYLETRRPFGAWSIQGPLGLNEDQFWVPINAMGAKFWEDLNSLPWADELLAVAEKLFPSEWYLCSAPSKCIHSYTGKVTWIKNKLGTDFDRFFISPHKELLAGPGKILLDDRESNVRAFRENRGLGVVFPSKGNSFYYSANDPMPTVTAELEACVR